MVKITFWREGSANNSSSSHSIIFTSKPLTSDEDSDFGWNFFTASDPDDKMNYCIKALHCTWLQHNAIPWSTTNINHKDIEAFTNGQFIKWFKLNFNDLYRKVENKIGYILDEVSIDHQSVFTFPSYRNTLMGLNVEFAKAWIDEIVNGNYAILGGNDNDDKHRHQKYHKGDTDAIKIYDLLSDSGIKNIIVKDEETDEWVLSTTNDYNKSGLYKFKI